MNFLVNALAFYYGGKLITDGKYDIEKMFTVFMAIIFGSMSAGRAFDCAIKSPILFQQLITTFVIAA